MRNWLDFVIQRISIVIFFNCSCLICLSLSSSFFMLMNIDDLGIGGSVNTLGRGDMRVLGTSWSACNRQQESGSNLLFSYFSCVLANTPMESNGLSVTLQLGNAQRVAVVYDVVDDSHTTICPVRLCPHVRCQPKDDGRVDVSFDRQTHFWPLEVSIPPGPPIFFSRHNFTQARQL